MRTKGLIVFGALFLLVFAGCGQGGRAGGNDLAGSDAMEVSDPGWDAGDTGVTDLVDTRAPDLLGDTMDTAGDQTNGADQGLDPGLDMGDPGQETAVCVPECAGRECGPDGCGGSCGECGEGMACAWDTGKCQSFGFQYRSHKSSDKLSTVTIDCH